MLINKNLEMLYYLLINTSYMLIYYFQNICIFNRRSSILIKNDAVFILNP